MPTSEEIAEAASALIGTRVHTITPVEGFAGNQVVQAETSSGRVIVKLGDPTGTAAEAWVCERVRSLGVPAPEILGVDASLTRVPRPFLVMRVVSGAALAHPDHPSEQAAIVACGAYMRAVHDVVLDGFGWLGTNDAPPPPVGPHRTWAAALAEAVATLPAQVDAEVMPAALAARIEGRLQADEGSLAFTAAPRLLHGDLYLRHLFADDDHLTGIIDWGDATAGDPLLDLGRFSLAGRLAIDAFLRGYGEVDTQGRDVPRVLHLYAIWWCVQANAWEMEGGGDSFAHRVGWIERRLDALG